MAKKVNSDDLTKAIMDALIEYNDVVIEEFEKIAKEVAREGTKKLKKKSPRDSGTGGDKGHYYTGWAVKHINYGNGKFGFTVHNKKKPGLTHLLEWGHQMRQGGRARAFPHIKQVEKWCAEEFERRTEAMLKK